jgi:hypothetical protein
MKANAGREKRLKSEVSLQSLILARSLKRVVYTSYPHALVDLHNLREGEAVYFDERGKLHDQFSIHSSSYSGKRTYISDAEHKALIEAKQRIVLSDCVQSRDEIIARIKMLAARSDSQTCKNLYKRVLKDKRYDRSADIEELQSIERTVLETCN